MVYHLKSGPVFERSISLDHFYKTKKIIYKIVKDNGLAAILFLDHSKTRPIENRTKVDHSKTGHVLFLDPHCN